MNVLSLFDGISCGQIALNRASIRYDNYYASEILKSAIKVTQNNFPHTIQLGNVKNWKQWSIDWRCIDVLFAGFPCQAWSLGGKQLAIEDPRGELALYLNQIFQHLKSINPNLIFLFENVRMSTVHRNFLDSLFGVKSYYINSNLVSAQNRLRLYWSSLPEPAIEDRGIELSSILESGLVNRTKYSCLAPASGFYGRDHLSIDKIKNRIRRGYIPIYSSPSFRLEDGWRGLTLIEIERLQTLPDNYTLGINNHPRYDCISNGWTVDVIAHILKGINS